MNTFSFTFIFDVGEKVRVVGKDVEGVITKRTYNFAESKNGIEVINQYGVRKGDSLLSVTFYKEDELEFVDELARTNIISDKYKDQVYGLLQDVNLKNGNFDVVQGLSEEKGWEKERG